MIRRSPAARTIRAILADDEPLALERVHCLLSDEPDVEIVAECANGAQALNEIQKLRPDLLILDVQMPRLNGFEVLEALSRGPAPIPVVIFTTAHDEHAIRAFEFSALDYLLKPFTEARFKISLQRARALLAKFRAAETTSAEASPRPSQLYTPNSGQAAGRIFVRSAERIFFLKPGEIDRVEAAGNYVVLHSGKEQHILRETISAMEARLAPSGFMRISRSVIVNLACIREIQPVTSGRYSLLLKNGTRLDMTCTLADLQSRLGEV